MLEEDSVTESEPESVSHDNTIHVDLPGTHMPLSRNKGSLDLHSDDDDDDDDGKHSIISKNSCEDEEDLAKWARKHESRLGGSNPQRRSA